MYVTLYCTQCSSFQWKLWIVCFSFFNFLVEWMYEEPEEKEGNGKKRRRRGRHQEVQLLGLIYKVNIYASCRNGMNVCVCNLIK